MNIKDLIEILKDMDQERIVLVSRDSEGNGFHPVLLSVEEMNYYGGAVYMAIIPLGSKS